MCGDAIGTEVRRRAHQEDVFFLPSRKRTFFQKQIAGHGYFGVNHVRARSLRGEEIGQKSKLLPYCPEYGEVLLIKRLVAQIGHSLYPK